MAVPEPEQSGDQSPVHECNTSCVHNDVAGSASAVVQAHTINGNVQFLASTPAFRLDARPIVDWDPFDLDIHRSISTPGSMPDLPRYLRRQHDDELDQALEKPHGTLILLTGSSSTGKTRALYEAILKHDKLRHWPVVYPRTADDLIEACTRAHAEMILWLNETQNHLSGSKGAEAAAALRFLLQTERAPIALGTIWSQYWLTLTADSSHVRSLLEHKVTRIRVADRFNVSQMREAASTDPRLAIAASTSIDSRMVIQTMAGGPQLVERFQHPDDVSDRYGAALLAAAMDAKRVANQNLHSISFLQAAAEGYLSDEDRVNPPQDWFDRGLDRVANSGYHGISALAPRRLSLGIGAADAYELHDYLDQYGRKTREHTFLPDSLWDALTEHLSDHEERLRLTRVALDRMRYRNARRLYESASSCSHWSNLRLMDVLIEHGWIDEFRTTVDRVPDGQLRIWGGDPPVSALKRLKQYGRRVDLEACLWILINKRVDLDWAGFTLVELLIDGDRAEEARAVAANLVSGKREAAALIAVFTEGHPTATSPLASQASKYFYQGLADRLAEIGDTKGLNQLRHWGSDRAAGHLFQIFLEKGDLDTAFELAKEGISASTGSDGNRGVRFVGSGLASDWKRFPTAQIAAALSAQRKLSQAISRVKELLTYEEVHYKRIEEQFTTQDQWHINRSGARNRLTELLVDLLAESGKWDEAFDLLNKLPEFTEDWHIARLRSAGRNDRLRTLADSGHTAAREALVDILFESGQVDDALTLLSEYGQDSEKFRQRYIDALGANSRIEELCRRAASGDKASIRRLITLAQQEAFPGSRTLLENGLDAEGQILEN